MQDLFAVTLSKKVTNKVTGQKQPVIVQQTRNIVEYTLVKKLTTITPCTVQEASKKLHIEKIVPLTKGAFISVTKLAKDHPLEFKLEGEMILNALLS